MFWSGSRGGIRPTRRDLLIIILTVCLAYLFIGPSHHVPAVVADNRPRLKSGLANLLTGKGAEVLCGNLRTGDGPTFEQAVEKVGFRTSDEHDDPSEDEEYEKMSTKLMGHTPGWSMFEKLYIFNGQLWVITDKREDFPELRMLTSTGIPAVNEPGNEEAREPKGDEIIFRTPREAHEMWGENVYRMRGMTWILNDGQFIDHYYHFAAELLLGIWRVHSTLDPDISPEGHSKIEPPARAWFLHQDSKQWRDVPRFNPVIMFGCFPNIALLYPEDMEDMRTLTTSEFRKKAFVLDRAILADRSAAFRGPHTGPTSRTVAGAIAFGKASRWWWEPIRRQMLRFAAVDEAIINRNLEGYGAIDPVIYEGDNWTPEQPKVEPIVGPGSYKPVVTYISRQGSRRRLTEEAHKELVDALEERARKVGFELIILKAEKYTKEEQIAIAAKTTIMLGVHGNGLSHLLWMPPTPRSAVIEMFARGGYARDYSWTAHALGMRHFAVQHDEWHTRPDEPEVAYPEGPDGFQGSRITVVGSLVADLIEKRLTGQKLE